MLLLSLSRVCLADQGVLKGVKVETQAASHSPHMGGGGLPFPTIPIGSSHSCKRSVDMNWIAIMHGATIGVAFVGLAFGYMRWRDRRL